MNKKLLNLLATTTTALVISNMSSTVVNAKKIDFPSSSFTKVTENHDALDIYDQIYISLFTSKNLSKINLEEIEDDVNYLKSGFHHPQMIKINQIILSRLLQDVQKSPFIKGVKANEVTNELSYQSNRHENPWISRIDLDGQSSTLTYASENYQNLWVMKYSLNENTTSNGCYQFVISEINNRHLNLSYTKGSKMLILYYHAFPNENEYICYFLKEEEQLQNVLKTMVEAMNNHQSIDEFLVSDILAEIDTSKKLSSIAKITNESKILEKKSTNKVGTN